MLRNEAREEEGLDPLEGLDEPMQPANMMTLEQAEKQEQQTQRQPAGPGDEAGARLALVLRGNAARMARRLAGGNSVTPETLAEALAIDEPAAAGWLQQDLAGRTEDELTASLVTLGETA
jgi:hypothetical protein